MSMKIIQYLKHFIWFFYTFPVPWEDHHLFLGTVPEPGATEEHFICHICGATKTDILDEPVYGDVLYDVYMDRRPVEWLLELIESESLDTTNANVEAAIGEIRRELREADDEDEQNNSG